MWRRLHAMFAWREVRDAGVWVYFENDISGARKCIERAGAGWQPVDHAWLAARDGWSVNRYGKRTQFHQES